MKRKKNKSLKELSAMLYDFLLENEHPISTVNIYRRWGAKLLLFIENHDFSAYDESVENHCNMVAH
jgi:hypothetical protein